MAVTIDGTSGINTPGVVNTAAETIATTLAVTGVTTFAAGTAALPAITTTGDTNTGIFFPAADTVGVATGGSERVRVDSSGNVGIGTTSPSTYVSNGGLAIVGAFGTSSKAMTIYNTSGANASNVARIDFKLNNTFSNGSTSAAIYGINPNASGNNGGALVFAVSSDGTDTNPSERARIDSSGNLLVGTTSQVPGYGNTNTGQQLGGSSASTFSRGATDFVIVCNQNTADGSTYYQMQFRVSNVSKGSITSTSSATAYNTSSDYRLKENIAPMTGALAKVAQLKPVIYKWKIDGSDGEGFIAHELAEVCPNAVSGAKDAVDENGDIKPQGIDVSFLVATLTAAIQEQQALITALTTRITALEAA